MIQKLKASISSREVMKWPLYPVTTVASARKVRTGSLSLR